MANMRNTTRQSTITEECREAYNSLIERKSSLIGKFETNEFKLATAKTLPRKLLTINSASKHLSEARSHNDEDLCAPSQQAPRPTTLPYRGANKVKKSDTSESSPLRILRDKNFPMIRPRPKALSNEEVENVNPHKLIHDGSDKDSVCESPSYMTNSSYTFPDNKSNDRKTCNEADSANPIPLPPRDRTKIMQTNQKRHIRKHPLIIPAYGVQRTLNKVTEVTPVDEHPKVPFPGAELGKNLNHLSNFNIKCNSESKDEFTKVKKVTQEVVSTLSINNNKLYDSNCRTYENIEDIQISLNENNTDSASLHFESILEDDFNKVDIVASPDVVDGFCPFAIQKEEYHKSKEVDFDSSKMFGLYVNEDELRNLDLERKKIEFTPKHAKYFEPNNELASHALFNKVRENVDLAMQQSHIEDDKDTIVKSRSQEDLSCDEQQDMVEMRLKDSNSVSCEDLLEFADKKPKGCERGVDSDEVRIMLKVLGKDASPDRCLAALEFIEWDVHKAIKLIKLQNILNIVSLSLQESVEALQKYEWDLQATLLKLKGLK